MKSYHRDGVVPLMSLVVATVIYCCCWSTANTVSAMPATGDLAGDVNALAAPPLASHEKPQQQQAFGAGDQWPTEMPASVGTPISVFENDSYGNCI